MRPREQGTAEQAALARIAAGAGARLAATTISVACGVAVASLTVRLLGTDDYGALAFALSFAFLVGSLGRLGLDAGIARTVASLSVSKSGTQPIGRVASGALTLALVSGLIGAVLAYVVVQVAPLGLAHDTRLTLGVSLGVIIVAANACIVIAAVARGLGRVALMEAPNVVVAAGRLGAVGVLAGLGLGEVGWIAAGYAVAAASSLLVAGAIARALLPRAGRFRPSPSAAREALALATPFAVTSLAVIMVARFDVVLLGLSGSPRDVGVYEPVLRAVEQLTLLAPLLLGSQYLPAATRLFREEGAPALLELYVSVSKLSFAGAFPAVVVLAAFPEAVLGALYGPDFPVRAELAWLLLAGFGVNLAFGLAASTASAVGDRRVLFQLGAVGLVAMVTLAFALIPAFGPVGASIATAASYGLVSVAASAALLRTTGIHPLRPDFLVMIATSSLPLAASLAVRHAIGPDGLGAAVAWTLGLWGVWVAALVLFRALPAEELGSLFPGRSRRR